MSLLFKLTPGRIEPEVEGFGIAGQPKTKLEDAILHRKQLTASGGVFVRGNLSRDHDTIGDFPFASLHSEAFGKSLAIEGFLQELVAFLREGGFQQFRGERPPGQSTGKNGEKKGKALHGRKASVFVLSGQVT